MRFELDGRTVSLREAELQRIVEKFLELLDTDLFTVGRVWVFGGVVNEPEKVHGDIDLLLEVVHFPSEIEVSFMAFDWADAIGEHPELALVDCFLYDGRRVATFSHDLPYLQVFSITVEPGFGGLDDDDTSIYIGEKVELFRDE